MKLHPKEFLAAKLTDLHTRYILYWALPVNLCSYSYIFNKVILMNLRESNCLGTPFALAAVKVQNTFKSKPLLLCPHWLLHIQTLVSL